MGRLFWKILFWFWFAMIPMGIGIAWGVAELISDSPSDYRRQIVERVLHRNVRALALVMEHGGAAAAKRYLTDLGGPATLPGRPAPPPDTLAPPELQANQLPPHRTPKPFRSFSRPHRKTLPLWDLYVLDVHGEELLQRPVPAWALNIPTGSRSILAQPAVTPDGEQYSIVARLNAPQRSPRDKRRWTSFRLVHDLLNHPRQLGVRLLLGILISGLVCFALSWYLTQPVKKLRTAARRLSAGDFETRVAQTIGARDDEISKLAWDFDHMADRIQALIAAEQSLLNDVSHEFRSPLARLQVAVGLARHKASEQAVPELDRIEREITRLDDLVGQVLMLSRLDANAMDGCHDYVDLPALLEDVSRDAEFEATAKNRHICIARTLKDCTFKANVCLLHSALENVIRNAVKYTGDDTTVTLYLDRDTERPGRVQLQVCDQGSGVPEAMLPKLFDPFFRVETARDRDTGGYGLGLAIARRAIQVHGGTITAQNRDEGGLCVVIALPIT